MFGFLLNELDKN